MSFWTESDSDLDNVPKGQLMLAPECFRYGSNRIRHFSGIPVITRRKIVDTPQATFWHADYRKTVFGLFEP
jgi:hypothetical protein